MIKKKKSSLLSNQKIKNKLPQKKGVNYRKTLLIITVCGLLCGSLLSKSYKLSTKKLFQSHQNRSLPLKVDLSNLVRNPIQNKINSYFQKSPVFRHNISESARRLQKHLAAKSITFIRTKHDTVAVFAELHHPIAYIDFGYRRLLSKNAKIFGKVGTEPLRIPIIKGIQPLKKIQLNKDMSLNLDSSNQELLLKLVDMLRISNEYQIKYQDITYIKGRGFLVSIRNSRISAQLGLEKFPTTIKRLSKVLKDLSSRGINNARIELDFGGKAFIKVSSL